MNDIHFEDLMDVIISDAVELPFIEFYKTVFNKHKESLTDERNLAWMLWMMSRKINGNEEKARKFLSDAVKLRAKKREEKAEANAKEFDKYFVARLKAMQDNGEIMTGKVRSKYKRIIEMLCIGSTYDFETAMRTEFPNFARMGKKQ